MDFIYNDGTSAHRGVWHLAEELTVRETPAEVRTETYQVINWSGGIPRSKAVPGVEYHKSQPYYNSNEDGCAMCGVQENVHPKPALSLGRYPYTTGHAFEEIRYYPILGKTTVIADTPAYSYYSAKAACGSGKFGGPNIEKADMYRIGNLKRYTGKTLRIVGGRVIDKYYRSTDVPPQPFCGHCRKIIVSRYGVPAAETTDGILEVIG